MKIEVETYEEYRRHFFAEQKVRAQKRYDRLLKRYADYPFMSIEAQRVQDAGRELQLYEDVCGMLEKAHGEKQSEGEWLSDRFGMDRSVCSVCGATFEGDGGNYCRKCGAKMKGGAE